MEERFETFTLLVTNINRYIRKIKTEEIKVFNLKSPHVSCLYYLYKEGKLTAKELSYYCEEDKANISRAIEFLEKKGYIACLEDKEKRYRSPLALTEAGKKVGLFISRKVEVMLSEASSGLTDAERENMYKSLQMINDNLKAICDLYSK